MQNKHFWFSSSLFQLEPGETDDPNPPVHGKQLAHWLAGQLAEQGYAAPDVIPEDWGWCVMCVRKPFFLWVGCGSTLRDGVSQDRASLDPARDLLWHCFAVAERPFWRWWYRRATLRPGLETLTSRLEAILRAESQICLLPDPETDPEKNSP